MLRGLSKAEVEIGLLSLAHKLLKKCGVEQKLIRSKIKNAILNLMMPMKIILRYNLKFRLI